MYVSGVPMLEQQHDEKYGDDPRYDSPRWKKRGAGVGFFLHTIGVAVESISTFRTVLLDLNLDIGW